MPGVPVGVGYVDIRPDMSGFSAELKRAVARDLSNAGREGGSSLKASLTDAAKGAAAAFGAAFAAVKIKDFFGDTIKAASDLAESVSKAGVVFGSSIKEVQDFAATSSTAFGQSRQQALESTATFGNLFTAMGLGTETAADMSISLVKLASDLASFNNRDIEDAFTALRSGLVGEQEPLRRFGVNINEATLKAKALQLGLKVTTATLDPAIKAQAAYALIMEQTTTAQGDFARTSNQLANQQRITTAQWKDAKAAIGETLLPVMVELAHVVNETLIPALQTLFLMPGADAEGWASALRDIIGDTIGFILGAYAELARGTANLIGALPGDLGSGLVDNLRNVADAVDGARERLHASTGELLAWNEAADQASSAAHRFGLAVAGSLPDLKAAAVATGDNAKALQESTKAARDSEGAKRDYAKASRDLAKLEKQGAVDAEKVADAQRAVTDAIRGRNHAQRELANAQREFDQAKAAADILGTDTAQEKLADAADNLADAKDSAASADERAAEAQKKLSEAKAGDPDYNDKLADAKDRVADAQDRMATTADKATEKSNALAAGIKKVDDAAKSMIETFKAPGVAEDILQFLRGVDGTGTPPLSPAVPSFGVAPSTNLGIGVPGVSVPKAAPVLGPPLPAKTGVQQNTFNMTFNQQVDPMLIGKAVAWQLG